MGTGGTLDASALTPAPTPTPTSTPTPATGCGTSPGSRILGNGRFDADAYAIPDPRLAIPNASFIGYRPVAVTVVDWKRGRSVGEGGGAEGEGGWGMGLCDSSGGGRGGGDEGGVVGIWGGEGEMERRRGWCVGGCGWVADVRLVCHEGVGGEQVSLNFLRGSVMRNIARWDLIVSQDSKDLEGALYMQRTCASDRRRVSRSGGRSFFSVQDVSQSIPLQDGRRLRLITPVRRTYLCVYTVGYV